MAKYGNARRVVDFVGRSIPVRGNGLFADLLVHRVLSLLKKLDEVQHNNPLVTLSFGTGGGVWVLHEGQRIFLIWPTKSGFVRVILKYENRRNIKDLISNLKKGAKLGAIEVSDDIGLHHWRTWRVQPQAFSVLESFVERLPKPAKVNIDDASHPRYFPGNLREEALTRFEREGSMCPGVDGKMKRHKVTTERIEFDHIVPYSRRGASSVSNIQVLCSACNNLKRDKACTERVIG
ncbi:HNH endonuclease [Rhodopseudomonas palustris]|uniref:HNH endonuclease n=1 Tax=Rhodopseudomonas palustris TaxID=1076 RepID=UPI001A9F1773|nr:HNH endonuclease signature motif containing protein [Rhodopseudomonas palustris]